MMTTAISIVFWLECCPSIATRSLCATIALVYWDWKILSTHCGIVAPASADPFVYGYIWCCVRSQRKAEGATGGFGCTWRRPADSTGRGGAGRQSSGAGLDEPARRRRQRRRYYCDRSFSKPLLAHLYLYTYSFGFTWQYTRRSFDVAALVSGCTAIPNYFLDGGTGTARTQTSEQTTCAGR